MCNFSPVERSLVAEPRPLRYDDTPASASRALLLSSFPHKDVLKKNNYVHVIPDRPIFRPPHGGAAAAPTGGAYL